MHALLLTSFSRPFHYVLVHCIVMALCSGNGTISESFWTLPLVPSSSGLGDYVTPYTMFSVSRMENFGTGAVGVKCGWVAVCNHPHQAQPGNFYVWQNILSILSVFSSWGNQKAQATMVNDAWRSAYSQYSVLELRGILRQLRCDVIPVARGGDLGEGTRVSCWEWWLVTSYLNI